jgi:small subunit ribosomal protein S17
MKKLEGIVVSTGMKNTIIVEVFRKTPHPMYRKIIKRSKKYKVDNTSFEDIVLGSRVVITETRPISKDKYFKVSGIVGLNSAKKITKKSEKEVEEVKLEVKKAKGEKITDTQKGKGTTSSRKVSKSKK